MARCVVCCHRAASGWSSGADDGRGAAGRRSRGAAPHAWGAALVGDRAPAWRTNRGGGVCALRLWTHAWERSACHPALEAWREATPRARGKRSNDCVAVAVATAGALRLPATARPRVTPGAPRRHAGRIGQGSAPGAAGADACPGGPAAPARRGAGPPRAAPPPTGPCARPIPRWGTRDSPKGGWRAHRPHASAAPGCSPRANTRSPSPPPAAPPRAALPRGAAAGGAGAGGARRHGGRPRGPGQTAARPAARQRAKRGGGPRAPATPPRARGAPGGRSTPSAAASSAHPRPARRAADRAGALCRGCDCAGAGGTRGAPPLGFCGPGSVREPPGCAWQPGLHCQGMVLQS